MLTKALLIQSFLFRSLPNVSDIRLRTGIIANISFYVILVTLVCILFREEVYLTTDTIIPSSFLSRTTVISLSRLAHMSESDHIHWEIAGRNGEIDRHETYQEKVLLAMRYLRLKVQFETESKALLQDCHN